MHPFIILAKAFGVSVDLIERTVEDPDDQDLLKALYRELDRIGAFPRLIFGYKDRGWGEIDMEPNRRSPVYLLSYRTPTGSVIIDLYDESFSDDESVRDSIEEMQDGIIIGEVPRGAASLDGEFLHEIKKKREAIRVAWASSQAEGVQVVRDVLARLTEEAPPIQYSEHVAAEETRQMAVQGEFDDFVRASVDEHLDTMIDSDGDWSTVGFDIEEHIEEINDGWNLYWHDAEVLQDALEHRYEDMLREAYQDHLEELDDDDEENWR